MRSEAVMMDRILSFAQLHDEIRGVVMNGSRVNPTIEPDCFQDYDIVFFVSKVEPFNEKEDLIPYFGEVLVMQMPEGEVWGVPLGLHRATYLVQFMDGNRIDMHFVSLERMEDFLKDSLTKVLLDKGGLLEEQPEPDESSYWVIPPTKKQFQNCCNKFSFCLGSHIPKTIWRRELPLLKQLIESDLRESLIQMLSWKISVENENPVSIGKGGKKLEGLLSPDEWLLFLETYAGTNYKELWNSLSRFYELFMESGRVVARAYNFSIPEECEKAKQFLERVEAFDECGNPDILK
ncbi:aminoglycoside 6-adenylyltransferase [Halobacillus yeomjeoni]|uniref:aminoglycoside 6-adenylyltransferase n=1 Tax=Halobacillus yeomjeoni TaxID=311194 RepID=UPI001CD5C40D|nr:aminoglycoside 6-adenylyltransferase [Halobacillus yeomjeoni]MCA0982868.1 aminoglycoside 6-adenylyltransferase [Halobacillus yeomjeoni]